VKHSITEAAKLAGVARSTMFAFARSGKITTEIDGKGRRVIDTAELLRVFGELRSDGLPDTKIDHARSPAESETAVLHERIRGLEALLAARDEAIAARDAELGAYREREQAYRDREQRLLQLLLAPPATPSAPAPAAPAESSEPAPQDPTPAPEAPRRRRWWLFGRRR
jgi:DNA-binding transcriptional MerR regulator